MAGGAETPNIAALPAIARLGACESARGSGADRRVPGQQQHGPQAREADDGRFHPDTDAIDQHGQRYDRDGGPWPSRRCD
jgi:hypothetical protein